MTDRGGQQGGSAPDSPGDIPAVTGRDAVRAEQASPALPAATGIALNVRDEQSVAAATDQAWSRLGGLDLLVNNAGLG